MILSRTSLPGRLGWHFIWTTSVWMWVVTPCLSGFCCENLEDLSPSSGQFRDWCFPALPLGWAAGMSVLHLCAQILSQGRVLRVFPAWEDSGLCLLFFKRPGIWSSSSPQVTSRWKPAFVLCPCLSSLSPLSSEMACFFPVSPWVHLINYKANFI